MIDKPSLNGKSMVYMYGLSDMWVDIFEDTAVVEAVLASTTINLAEVYSYFLQRSSGISLNDIQDKYQTRIKLLLVGEDDLVNPSDLSLFKVDSNLFSAAKISNRPLLPTETLSSDIDYEIVDGTIRFNKPITSYKFARRVNSEGKWQFAAWMTDVVINDKWIDTTFGKLVGFTEEDAIYTYKSFLEGIYYLYSNGPNISYIERGVNLAMGMPYARETEDVLAVIDDPDTGNYHVFTATQTYEIPFGFNPGLVEGSRLTRGSVLASWVEVNDYYSKGEWWYDVYLPQEVLKGITPSELGKAEPGTTGDAMMKTFLKHHMFQVLVTQPNSDPDAFSTAVRLVLYSKPEYTYPVFVWKVPIEDEEVSLEYEFTYDLYSSRQDTCISAPSIVYMDRGLENNPFVRGINWYNRCQGSIYAATLLGYGDWYGNGGWSPEFQEIEPKYEEYLSGSIRNRGSKVAPVNRSTVIRGWRGVQTTVHPGLDWSIDGLNCSPRRTTPFVFNDNNYTILYMMTHSELINKLKLIAPGITVDNNTTKYVITNLNLQQHYYNIVVRDNSIPVDTGKYNIYDTKGGLYDTFSKFANQAYSPRIQDMPTSDGVIFLSKINDYTWGVYWVNNHNVLSPTIFPVEDSNLTIAEEVYDYSRLSDDYVKMPMAIMPYTDSVDVTKEITHGSQVAIFFGTNLKTNWVYSANTIDMTTALNTVAHCVFLPTSTHTEIFDFPVYTENTLVSEIFDPGFGSIGLGEYDINGYTDGIDTVLKRMTFLSGGTDEGIVDSSYVGTKFMSITGCVIEVTSIVDSSTFEYTEVNCTEALVVSSFSYPNTFTSIDNTNYPTDIESDYLILSESVSDKHEVLVVSDNLLTFEYSVLNDRLYLENIPVNTSGVKIQYVHRDVSLPEDTSWPIGTSSITLSGDLNILLFIGSRYIPEFRYSRSGVNITLQEPSTDTVWVRYFIPATEERRSHITRSTVGRNGAVFLRDRSRVNGEYTDMSGYTSNINRSGVYGTEPLRIPRRLI